MAYPVLGTLAVFLIWQLAHLAAVLSWSDRQTRGLRYCGRPGTARRRFKRWLRLHAALLSPILWMLSKLTRPQFSGQRFVYRDVAGPKGACSPESFRRASEYSPGPDDLFIATQMRSGTTWMQHLAYQVLTRGTGDLAAMDQTLNAVSPWLESLRTVPVEDAPLIGCDRQQRVIKTHLPASLCPFDRRAKYVYVVRHPLACFASSVDFVRNNLQGFAPDLDEFVRWFQSDDLMWWSTWPDHVTGWYRLAEKSPNVMLVRFEEMASDLGAVVDRLAAFVDVPALSQAERRAVLHKCDFQYMRAHDDCFEMHPPHLLQAAHSFFVSGSKDRRGEISAEVQASILQWCRQRRAGDASVIGELYPDLAADAHVASSP